MEGKVITKKFVLKKEPALLVKKQSYHDLTYAVASHSNDGQFVKFYTGWCSAGGVTKEKLARKVWLENRERQRKGREWRTWLEMGKFFGKMYRSGV